MITVQDHRHSVVFGHESHMLSSSNGSQDGSFLSRVLDTFTSQECGSSIGELKHLIFSSELLTHLHLVIIISYLNNNWRVDVSGGLEDGIDGRG